LALALSLLVVTSASGQVNFTQEFIIATGAEVSSGVVKIRAEEGTVDIVYKNASGQLAYRSYEVGGPLSEAEIVESGSNTYWLGGIGRGEGKIKIGYCRLYNIGERTRDEEAPGTGWTLTDTSYDGVSAGASGSYAVNPVTGLSGFVARASNGSVFHIQDQGAGSWGGFTAVLDAGSGSTYPDLVYAADGTPYVGSNYGYVSAVGPAPWAGAVGDLRRVHTTGAYNAYHNALAERNGTRYFVNVRANSDTRLYATNAQGDWVYDSQITNKGYYGDGHEIAMAVSPTGKIAVLLYDQKAGDTVPTLYLATKGGLGGGYSWQWNRLAEAYQWPDVYYDRAGNLFVAYYNPADDNLYLATTTCIVRPEDYPAEGEVPADIGDGEHDDTAAFAAAAAAINAAGSGVLALDDNRTYRVGGQYHVPGQYPYYKTSPVFHINNIPPYKDNFWVAVQGCGSHVKVNDGLRIGSFDPSTGEAYYPASLPFSDDNYHAQPGYMFLFQHCDSVRVRNLDIDGNNTQLIIGGQFGDTGYQCGADGLSFFYVEKIRIDNVNSSYHGRDGMYIRYDNYEPEDPEQDILIQNSTFEFNARQGLSWVGGAGLVAKDCKFNHTGRSALCSSPAAGVDIEASDAVIRNGKFINCDFVNNVGCGMVADNHGSANVTFDNCLFWGTTNHSIWPNEPGFVFNNCTIFGHVVHAYGSEDPAEATQFYDCDFEDYTGTYEGYGPYGSCTSSNKLIEVHGENVRFEDCDIIGNTCEALFLDGLYDEEFVTGCTITHNAVNRPDGATQSSIRGSYIEYTTFHENLVSDPLKSFYILRAYHTVGPEVYVDGPRCKWGGGDNGLIGLIPETP
jgi:hypothetical protein